MVANQERDPASVPSIDSQLTDEDFEVIREDASPANDPDGPQAFEGTLMDGLEDEPPYPASSPTKSDSPYVPRPSNQDTKQEGT